MKTYLYVCRGNMGLLKVGRTANTDRRFKQLASVFSSLGEMVVSFEATQAIQGCPKSAEKRLVDFVKASGAMKFSGREWFLDAFEIPVLHEAHRISQTPEKKKIKPARASKENPSSVATIRMRAEHWRKLRDLMTHYQNRVWLEKAIDRAHNRVFNHKEKS